MRMSLASDAFVAMLLVAALVGIAFIGVAFGHAVKLGSLVSMSQHPLLSVGVQCLSSSVVCGLLLLGIGKQ